MYERTVHREAIKYDLTSFSEDLDPRPLSDAFLDQLNRGDILEDMDIPSNSEIYLTLSNLISKIEDHFKTSDLDAAWLDNARDLRDRMMASDYDTTEPPEWVDIKSCSQCGGRFFEAAYNSQEGYKLAPKAIEFRSTKATLYPKTLNIEFDNRRIRVGSGQTMRRWFKHEDLCGVSLEDTIELLKPVWLATYRPVNKESSINSLKDILNARG